MKISTKQYTEALFQACQEKNNLDRVLLELEIIIQKRRPVRKLLENPQLGVGEKINYLKKTGFSPKMINFLFILGKNKSLDKLATILLNLKELRNEKTNTLEVVMATPWESSESNKEKVSLGLKRKLKKKIDLKTETDPTLIGGMTIRIGDKLIDSTVKSKLELLKDNLAI